LQQSGTRISSVTAADVFGIAGHGNGRQNTDYRYHDHDFNECEAALFSLCVLRHGILSLRHCS